MEPIFQNEIRIDLIFKLIKDKWKNYVWVSLITFIVSAVLILCVPRYYTATAVLVPEYGEQGGSMNVLGSAASILGVNLGGAAASGTIVPEFYPDIIMSTDFLVDIMDSHVESKNDDFSGTYAEYINTCLKYPFWSRIIGKIKKIFSARSEPLDLSADYKINPFELSKSEFDLIDKISSTLGCSVDDKTGVISLSVTTQDPLVAALMANNLKDCLQDFVTEYRTEKNRTDLKYITELSDSAYSDYLVAQRKYAEYVDKHQTLSRQTYRVEAERLSGEVQVALGVYNTLYQQKLSVEAELLKSIPVFTTLQNTTVPLLPAGPKRKLFVLGMTILSIVMYTIILIVISESKRLKGE